MPNCFELIRKGETEPSTLISVDIAICEHLDMPVDPKRYADSWYDIIGLGLACGKTLAEIAAIEADYPTTVKICDFLAENYTVNTFYSSK